MTIDFCVSHGYSAWQPMQTSSLTISAYLLLSVLLKHLSGNEASQAPCIWMFQYSLQQVGLLAFWLLHQLVAVISSLKGAETTGLKVMF